MSGTRVVVALDAMGGDHAPQVTVRGALDARDEMGIEVLLVGEREVLRRHLEEEGRGELPILHAPEVIGMEEEGALAVRSRENSSLVVAAEAVREGKAQALVSAGNTGAAMAASLLSWGRIRGAKRPAVAVVLPPPDSPTLLLDAGANADCRPEHLRQFALLGSAYASLRFGLERPRVGLLNIGTEEGKGNQLAREAYEQLSSEERIDFVGNIEGRDIAGGAVDVVVTDGFTGNVTLKVVEGVASFITRRLLAGLGELGEEGMKPVLPALLRLREELDYRAIGGAPLLGVKGVCIIAHGSSDAVAIKNSLRVAAEAVEMGLVERTERLLSGRGPEG
ncbi:phosphate acyltransferase PlsX [Candidatus Solincola tengchongensis]|uniref:phosphate acyltransferase PlsX n=1 Tax=Candidatus Solincola tengchongensis TaxID=2900693 RepID=UPI00257D892F|nr:phosphate acyltransferase PlsX [Candidatus Solincola tengchongensis]